MSVKTIGLDAIFWEKYLNMRLALVVPLLSALIFMGAGLTMAKLPSTIPELCRLFSLC